MRNDEIGTSVPISVAVLENIPPMLIVASAMTTAFVELVTIAGTTGREINIEPEENHIKINLQPCPWVLTR